LAVDSDRRAELFERAQFTLHDAPDFWGVEDSFLSIIETVYAESLGQKTIQRAA